MIKVLVTGTNGQLGRCIRDLKVDTPEIDFTFVGSEALDITNDLDVNAIFDENDFDYCINCAAYTAVDKAESDIDNAFLVNAEGVKYLAAACKGNNVILIHISTDFVFDGEKGEPYTEEDVPNPINVYGASKLKGEEYVQEILEKYFIVRTSWVYSEYGNNFVKTMLRLADERDEINVVSDQVGSPTYAGDLACFLINFISSQNDNYGIYHYSNDGVISWYEFATEIFRIANVSIKVNEIKTVDYPTPAKRPIFSVLNKSRVKYNFPNIQISDWKMSLKKMLLNYI